MKEPQGTISISRRFVDAARRRGHVSIAMGSVDSCGHRNEAFFCLTEGQASLLWAFAVELHKQLTGESEVTTPQDALEAALEQLSNG
jgi:hypothetical protein